jgi:hypothetical protein
MQSDSAVQRDWATTLIAIYGAVLATIVFLWDLYKRWADSGKLEVRNFIGAPFKTDDGKIGYGRIDIVTNPDHSRPLLVYKITTQAARPSRSLRLEGATGNGTTLSLEAENSLRVVFKKRKR